MFVPLFTQGGSNKFLALALLITRLLLLSHQAIATSCQPVYPSEYAYRDDSVTRTENVTANCRSYPAGNVQGDVRPEDYIHCDGTQLKLTDSNFGQEQYQPTDYYVWSRSVEALFIFPTRVSLTTITLHYYSDSARGLPKLTFYAVPDDFDVWDAPSLSTSYPHADVTSAPPAGGGLAGHRGINININFNSKKLLMYKRSTTFQFAVSEVEFFTCTTSTTMVAISTSSVSTTNIMVTTTGSLDFTEATLGTTVSSSGSPRSREIVAWVLVVMMQAII